MLIANAENLMRSVSGTLRAAESASVKVFNHYFHNALGTLVRYLFGNCLLDTDADVGARKICYCCIYGCFSQYIFKLYLGHFTGHKFSLTLILP